MVDNLGELRGQRVENIVDRFDWSEKLQVALEELQRLADSLGIREYLLGKRNIMLEADQETYRKASEQREQGIPRYKLFQPNYAEHIIRLSPAFTYEPLIRFFSWQLSWNLGSEPQFNHNGRMIYCGSRVSLEAQLTPDRLLRVIGKQLFGINLRDQSEAITEILDSAYSNPRPSELL